MQVSVSVKERDADLVLASQMLDEQMEFRKCSFYEVHNLNSTLTHNIFIVVQLNQPTSTFFPVGDEFFKKSLGQMGTQEPKQCDFTTGLTSLVSPKNARNRTRSIIA